jgi:hypothetical protein
MEEDTSWETAWIAPRRAVLRVAVTGHRTFADAATTTFITRAIVDTLGQLVRAFPDGVRALSGLAEGTDSLFAEAALQLKIPLCAVIAADDLSDTFPPGPARQRFLNLRQQAQTVYALPFRQAGPKAYAALGRALVDYSDLLIAAWDGRPAADAGGTGAVVAYARSCQRPVIHLNTLQHTIRCDPQLPCPFGCR